MNENLHFDGRQIKNYLVGFASLFAEIPYKDRYGTIKTVPIHYGSPSDVISYLENSVDNLATRNRNRIKDIAIPMFSFRLTGLEKNNEKRRAPHDTITVDLRSLGYSLGYVAMRPAPYRFTMELVCWASSDYQAFEITEQIIPYFNSPQQVQIEPLPKCPISTTEVFLENIEIDTEPDSQKYSALITMTFSLTGYVLAQPKIWSTNLEFELSMLDEKPGGLNLDDTDYSVGNEIVDLNAEPYSPPVDEKYVDIDKFIRRTPELQSVYGETLDWYNILVEHNRIDQHGNVIDTTQLVVDYNGEEKIFYLETIMVVAEKIEDVRYVFENEQMNLSMKSNTLEGNLRVLDELYFDDSDTILLYLKLLDNNLATKGFNTTNVEIMNSEKMRIFGTIRIDVDDVMVRLRNYLASLENLKIYKNALVIKGVIGENETTLLDNKFTDLNDYIVSILSYNFIQVQSSYADEIRNIVESKFGLSYESLTLKANEIKELINKAKHYIDIDGNSSGLIDATEINTGQQTVVESNVEGEEYTSFAQTVAVDNDGKPIYDANRDGYIDKTDLELLNANVDNPDDYDYELIYGVWHKRFRIENVTPEKLLENMTDLKTILYILEKGNYSEIIDALILINKNLITNSFDLFNNDENSDESKEIKSLGYDLLELDNSLLYLRLFSESMKNIVIDERDFIVYKIPEMNDESKSMLYNEQIDINRIILGKYLELYFGVFDTDDERIEASKKIIPLLNESLEHYMDYITEFNLMIDDMKETTIFSESLSGETIWLDGELPLIRDKLIEKYSV